MGNLKVGTPRIYPNEIAWGRDLGIDIVNQYTGNRFSSEQIHKLFSGNPTEQIRWVQESQSSHHIRVNRVDTGDIGRPNYCACLGHNFASAKIYPRHHYRKADNDPAGDHRGWNKGNSLIEIINANGTDIDWDTSNTGHSSTYAIPDYDGFSVWEVNESANGYYGVEAIQFNTGYDQWESFGTNYPEVKLGAIFMGRYWDAPHSAELQMVHEFQEAPVKSYKTISGRTISNSMRSAKKWGDLGAWELDDGSDLARLGLRSGRHRWKMRFRSIVDRKVLPVNAAQSKIMNLANMDSEGEGLGYGVGDDWGFVADEGYRFTNNITSGDDFFSCFNKVGGNTFIFQPDNTDANPSGFFLAKFVKNSIKVTQTSSKLYDISIDIEEV